MTRSHPVAPPIEPGLTQAEREREIARLVLAGETSAEAALRVRAGYPYSESQARAWSAMWVELLDREWHNGLALSDLGAEVASFSGMHGAREILRRAVRAGILERTARPFKTRTSGPKRMVAFYRLSDRSGS